MGFEGVLLLSRVFKHHAFLGRLEKKRKTKKKRRRSGAGRGERNKPKAFVMWEVRAAGNLGEEKESGLCACVCDTQVRQGWEELGSG